MAGSVRIGISGWSYPPWRGKFYPEKLRQKDELHFAAEQVPTIEVNGTFYSLQKPASFDKWAAETPDDFIFSIKGSRYITHTLRLREIDAALANFFASGLLRLGAKLGPILWQFPPNFAFEPERFEGFLKLLPHDTLAASNLAEQHDRRLDKRAWTGIGEVKRRAVRHAVEIRNNSFVSEAFVALLRRYNVALVCADTVEWPRLMDLTADFAYCRLHGSEQLYTSGYSDEALAGWAKRITAWAKGHESPDGDKASAHAARVRRQRDVFVYFDNDVKVYAPRDARTLLALVEKRLTS